MQTKFTVRVNSEWLDAARRYAATHDTTLTRLVSEYLHALSFEDVRRPPILRELTGSLKIAASLEDYHNYLEKKYGDDQNTG